MLKADLKRIASVVFFCLVCLYIFLLKIMENNKTKNIRKELLYDHFDVYLTKI